MTQLVQKAGTRQLRVSKAQKALSFDYTEHVLYGRHYLTIHAAATEGLTMGLLYPHCMMMAEYLSWPFYACTVVMFTVPCFHLGGFLRCHGLVFVRGRLLSHDASHDCHSKSAV